MAGANAYAGAFIGNDFVMPKARPQHTQVEQTNFQPPIQEQIIEQVQPPVPAVAATSAAPMAAAMPRIWALPKVPSISVPKFVSLRNAGLVSALLISGYLALLTYNGITHAKALAPVASAASTISQRVSDNIHHTPVYVGLPAYSLAIENSDLSSDMNNIENQIVSVNFSFASVSPTSAQVASWLTTSKGPKSGTTVLSVNTAAIQSYLTSQVKRFDQSPTNAVVSNGQVTKDGNNGVSYSGIQAATDELASSLLKATGSSVSLQANSVPYKTVQAN